MKTSILIAVFLLFSYQVWAAPITFYYGGTINSVVDQLNELDGSVTIGTTFSGLYTFKSTTPGTPITATRVDYIWRNATGSDGFFNLSIGVIIQTLYCRQR